MTLERKTSAVRTCHGAPCDLRGQGGRASAGMPWHGPAAGKPFATRRGLSAASVTSSPDASSVTAASWAPTPHVEDVDASDGGGHLNPYFLRPAVQLRI